MRSRWDLEHPEYYRRWNKANSQRQGQYVRGRKSVPCLDCGIQYPPHVMQFDHRDPATKKFNIAHYGRSLEKIRAEIEKCDVVCANCHFERTHQRRLAGGD